VSPLAAVELPNGAAIGLYSCPAESCVTRRGPRQDRGANGLIRLGTVFLAADVEGTLEVKLDAAKFVDAAGNPVAVTLTNPTITIQVGSGGPTIAAPGSMWSLQPPPAIPAGPFDLTGDGLVTNADAMEVALEWQIARLDQNVCGALPDPTRDVNHDGCIDVADAQMVAANYSPPSGGNAPVNRQFGFFRLAGVARPQSAPLTLTVNSTGDQSDSRIGNGVCQTSANTCTLRGALQEANAHAGPDNIFFNIPGGGVQKIQTAVRLPTLHDETGPTTIDGYTQPGAEPNTDPRASNAAIRVEVVGSGEGSYDGLIMTTSGNVVRGLAVYRFKRAFWIYGSGSTNNTVTGTFVGTNAAGTYGAAGLTSTGHGFHIEQGANGNHIGGTAPGERNVISGNARHGLGIWHERSDGNVVMNNIVGLNPSGTGKIPNRKHGLDLNFGAANNVFGGTGSGERNVVAGNDDTGVEVSHTTGTTNNRVVGNFIATDLSGNRSFDYTRNVGRGIMIEDGATKNIITDNVIGTNGRGGIEIYDAHTSDNLIANNRIGISLDGTPVPNNFGIYIKGNNFQLGPNNIIAHNVFIGIKVEGDGADNNTITRNSIFSNGTMGIDLWPRGPNQIDQYPHDGPNQRLNFPVLSAATPQQVAGTACSGCTIEVFIADSTQANTYGEGKTFAGAGTADNGGAFSVPVDGVTTGQWVTATATDGEGNTSEFSLNVPVTSG
jgi:hypothetical protein